MRHSGLLALLDPLSTSGAARAFRALHHTMLALGLAAILAITLPQELPDRPLLLGVALLSSLFFAAEWLLRLCIAPHRRDYALSFYGLIDAVAALVLPVAYLVSDDPHHMAPASMLWLLKVIRYVSGFALIGRVIANERRTLASVLGAFLMVLLLAGTLVYVVEREGQPDTFGSLPASLWWAIVTLTTTGYGDAVPATAAGRMVAGLVMIMGIAVFALWAGILASGFAAELRRRDFLRAWSLVAHVPTFSHLDAAAIADVARLLKPRRVPGGTVLTRLGQRGDCMYFIASGEVEVRLPHKSLRLGEGEFLGELALITGEPRRATSVTTCPTELLVLDIADFRDLAGRMPELMRAIEAEAARRQAERPK